MGYLETERIAYSPQEAAQVSGLSLPQVKREIKAKRLRAKKIGRRLVILAEDLREFLSVDHPSLPRP